MKKPTLMALALISAVAIAAPIAYANTTPADVQADMAAIAKDNAALKKDQATLRHDRMAKAQDKATDDTAQQAVDSTKIGATQSAIAEKKAEKNVDVNTLQDDKANMNPNSDDNQ